jgi:hypothetical protein
MAKKDTAKDFKKNAGSIRKPEFFVVWIEGLTPEKGEKIKTLDSFNHSYTTKMTEALRVKREDIQRVKDILRDRGVSEWALEGAGAFHKVGYAPKGTLFLPCDF